MGYLFSTAVCECEVFERCDSLTRLPQYLPKKRQTSSPMVVASLAALTILAALYFAWPVWRAFLPLEIDVNEPWNAYHADDACAGRTLYPDPDGLVANNYPPLSFYIVGAIASATFDAVYVGRMLSLMATAATALAVGCCIRQFGGSRTSALLAAIWFLATMARFFDTYVGMNDPNLLALAIMVWALVWLVRSRRNSGAVIAAILVMVVAGFIKHNLFAIPVTALCWLAMNDRRLALRAALVGGVAAALGLALCSAVYGEAFFRQLLMPREYSLAQALAGLGRLQWIAPALAIFAVWAWHERKGEAVRFATIFVAVAFVFHFMQKFGAGVHDNAQFELAVAAAIGLGLAFDRIIAIPAVRRWGIDRGRFAIILILIARLLASSCASPYLLVASPGFRANLRQQVAVMNAETERIAAIPAPVACSVMSVCRRAGKPFVFDAFAVDQRVKTGNLSKEELDRLIHAQGIRFEQVDRRTIAPWR